MGRIQLTSDGFGPYLSAVRNAFGSHVDFAQLVKLYGSPSGADPERRYSPGECNGTKRKRRIGRPERRHISTSFVERQNLNLRMGVRRFTRLTNAFSKKLENHVHAVALYVVWYNWCRRHKTLGETPAQAAGLTNSGHAAEWIVGLIDERTPAPGPRGPYKKRQISN